VLSIVRKGYLVVPINLYVNIRLIIRSLIRSLSPLKARENDALAAVTTRQTIVVFNQFVIDLKKKQNHAIDRGKVARSGRQNNGS
jgi:hypothetical protein